MCEGLVFSLLEGEGWVVWSKWDKGSNGKECVLRRNVSGMRKDSPMLSASTRNEGHSLDDAFDELLHWASTDERADESLIS